MKDECSRLIEASTLKSRRGFAIQRLINAMRQAYAEGWYIVFFFFQAEDGIRDYKVTGVQTCALPICAIVGLGRPTAGRIRIEGTEVTGLRGEALRQLRRRVQLVYQNPFSSLDPRQSVFDIIEEPLLNFDPLPADERRQRVHDMLERVGLPAAVLQRRPHALSGGQRQRVAIARALVLQPQVLVLDEAVSALDVTVQAQILALLAQLQQDLGLTYLFISHDLAVVRQIADTVSVLRAGRVVDAGSVEEVFQRPTSDYKIGRASCRERV